MEIIRRVRSMRETSRQAREKRLKIGFVPTMGALHEGHLALIRAAAEVCDAVAVSIFVNPIQFDSDEDLQRYPRTLTEDTDRCIEAGVDYLFLPDAAEMVPEGSRTHIEVAGLSDVLEGESRPGHFRGVATIVLKLLEVVRPDMVFFGQKDAQQCAVVRRMLDDLLLDVELSVQPTVRDDDGLALSSRNRFLTREQREAGLALPESLQAAQAAVERGERDAAIIVQTAREKILDQPQIRLDYLSLVDARSLESVTVLERPALLLAAVFCGTVRLLDNALLDPDG